ncbi:MAG: hypothetical protein KBD10_01925 [Candidatus Pacebacteria bacterium]|nr:hypothetical protein [Candidatus Paceibacterota bacterium]
MKYLNKTILILFFVSFLFPSSARAESVLWTTAIQDHAYTNFAGVIGYGVNTFYRVISNPGVQIRYNTRVTNVDTGALLACGDNVPLGTKVRFDFVEHQYTDVYWFGTGTANDSPYGSWKTNAARPTGAMCSTKNHYYTEGGVDHPNRAKHFADLSMNPPLKTMSGLPINECTSFGNNTTECEFNRVSTINANFNFAATYGKFYYGQSFVYVNGGICNSYTSPLQKLSRGVPNPFITFFQNVQPDNISIVTYIRQWPSPVEDFRVNVPAQTIACPINVIEPEGEAPSAPTVTGNPYCKAGVPSTYTITATDPDTEPDQSMIRYAIDWDNDGKFDQLVPSTGYVVSGTAQTVSHMWRTNGEKTFQVMTQDKEGLQSAWTSYTTAECLEPDAPLDDTLLDESQYNTEYPDGTLDFSLDKGVTNTTCKANWNTSYVGVCSLYKNDKFVEELAPSGEIDFTPGTYRIDCAQLSDGSLLSKTLRCLLNPDVKEI